MGAAEAYQAGGWPLVTIVLAIAVLAHLAQDNRALRKRIDELVDADRESLEAARKLDAEELKERRRREQEVRR